MPTDPKYRIMVVDDDEDVRDIVEGVLSVRYEVVTAHDGLDALEKIDNCEPDLVILDTVMPVMDGLQACEAIRRKPRYADIPVLFLSGHQSRDEIAETYKSGGSLFLAKPIEPARLLRNVDLFFERTPPAYRPKRLSMRRLQAIGGAHETPSTDQDAPPAPKPAPMAHRPARQQPTPLPRTAPQPQPEHAGAALTPRLLLVEDDTELAELMVIALSEHFEVVHAPDGLAAVEKTAKFQPDLMVVDVVLPKMDGYQSTKSVRSNPTFSKVGIIFVTGKSSPKEQEYADRVGGDAFLAKPFEMEDLIELCLGFARKPGFIVRPKRISAFQMRVGESQVERAHQRRVQKLEHLVNGTEDEPEEDPGEPKWM